MADLNTQYKKNGFNAQNLHIRNWCVCACLFIGKHCDKM